MGMPHERSGPLAKDSTELCHNYEQSDAAVLAQDGESGGHRVRRLYAARASRPDMAFLASSTTFDHLTCWPSNPGSAKYSRAGNRLEMFPFPGCK
jgi:hypothetical protein